MKRYLIILYLSASSVFVTALAEERQPDSSSPSPSSESIKQDATDPSPHANEQSRQHQKNEKSPTIATEKKRDPLAIPYLNEGYFSNAE